MDNAALWNNVYETKSLPEVSWYEPDPKLSVDLILGTASGCLGRIIDVGGGQSFLIDRLLDCGFRDVTVLDISQIAIEATKTRLGERATLVKWIVADICQCDRLGEFDIWHDRAVFHFLTDVDDRQRYLKSLKRSLSIGGRFVVGTFAIGGPQFCSGLPIRQYDAALMLAELGPSFELMTSKEHVHITPTGKQQPFYFGVYKRVQ